jgi:hypothetical protein
MRAKKGNAEGKTKAQRAQMRERAAQKYAEARQKGDAPLFDEAANLCPCDEDLTRLSEQDTDEIEVWMCDNCKCHHYFQK